MNLLLCVRLGQTSVFVFSVRVLSTVVGFVATIYFANVLGADILGIYFLIMSFVSWMQLVSSIGIREGLTKRLSEGIEIEEFVSAGTVMLTALFLILIGGLLLLRPYINQYIGYPSVSIYIISMVIVVSPFRLAGAILKGRHRVQIGALLSLGQSLGRSILQLGLVFIGFKLGGLVAGWVGAVVPVTIVAWLYIKTQTDIDYNSLPRRKHIESILSYAKYSWISGARGKIFNQLDILVLGYFVAPKLVGVYAVAWNIASSLQLFGTSIRTAVFPEISSQSAANNTEEVSNIITNSIMFTGLIIIPGLVGGFLLDEQILRIYGPEFVTGTIVLSLLIFGTILYEYKSQFTNALNAVNRPDLAFRSDVVLIVSNVILNVLMIYSFGWVGAAIATGVSAGLSLAVSFYYLRSVITLHLPYLELGRQIAATVVMATFVKGGLWLVSSYELINNNVILVLSLVVSGASVYFVLLYLVSSVFRKAIRDNLPSDIKTVM